MQNKSILFLIAICMGFVSTAFAKTSQLDGKQCATTDTNEFQCMVCGIYCTNATGEPQELEQDREIGRVFLNRVKQGLAKTVCEVIHAKGHQLPNCKLPNRNDKKYGSLLKAIQGGQEALQLGPGKYCGFGKELKTGPSLGHLNYDGCAKAKDPTTADPTKTPDSPGARDKGDGDEKL